MPKSTSFSPILSDKFHEMTFPPKFIALDTSLRHFADSHVPQNRKHEGDCSIELDLRRKRLKQQIKNHGKADIVSNE